MQCFVILLMEFNGGTLIRSTWEFSTEVRNIRFGLSTWPITLYIYSLPSWLCMKHKFIMMPLFISGPV
jgi:hypothetical protein